MVLNPGFKMLNALDLEEASMSQDMGRNSCVPSFINPGFSHCIPGLSQWFLVDPGSHIVCLPEPMILSSSASRFGDWPLQHAFFLSLCQPPCVISQQKGPWLWNGGRGQKPLLFYVCTEYVFLPWVWHSEILASPLRCHLWRLLCLLRFQHQLSAHTFMRYLSCQENLTLMT